VLTACASAPPRAYDASSQYELARGLLEDGKAKQAAVEFQKLLYNYPESVWADEAQMGLAASYYQSEQYLLAEVAYRRVLDLYPAGPLAAEAEGMIGLTLLKRARKAELDQEMTWRAKTYLERFLVSHADHSIAPEARAGLEACIDRLAEKDYKNGSFYLKVGRPGPATWYFDRVLREYPETSWAAKALLGRADSSRQKGDLEAATEDYEALLEQHAGTGAARTASQRLRRIRGET
jgi:outer membrane protein assembly factor BamD